MPFPDLVGLIFGGLLAFAMLWLLLFGVHSFWLLLRFRRHHRAALEREQAELAKPLPGDGDLPHILVQLPVFNERDVVKGVIDAACRLDWPRDRLTVQILDDSTDDTVQIVAGFVAGWAAEGVRIQHLHRTNRHGFKAGALNEGLKVCDAPYIAIFDADFIPRPDFLRRAIRPFLDDPGLGLVQGRWEHLNRHDNAITEVQAVGIDTHFSIEQGARAWSGLAMNFNGTCGMWRREAITAAGGWEHDTLTEDMDLSYRSQLAGWSCTYRNGLDVPGELPDSIDAYRSQQFRWAKGSMQTAKKLLPMVWRSAWPMTRKVAATLHMIHYSISPMMALGMLSTPLALWFFPWRPWYLVLFGACAIVAGLAISFTTYLHSQSLLHGARWWQVARRIPTMAALGTGISLSMTRAILEALLGVESPFVRTPKKGQAGGGSYRSAAHTGMPELLAAGWAVLGVIHGLNMFSPLLFMYVSGFGWIGGMSLRDWWRRSLRPAIERHAATPATGLRTLLTIGAASLVLYILLALRPDSRHETPALFAGLGLALGALYLVAARSVLTRAVGVRAVVVVLAGALAFRLVCLGLPGETRTTPIRLADAGPGRDGVMAGVRPGDEVARYLVEGRMVNEGFNPYVHPPGTEAALQTLSATRLDAASAFIADSLDRGDWRAVSAPAGLGLNALISRRAPHPWSFKLIAMLAEIGALGLALGFILRRNLSPGLLLVAAWNPLGPLFLTGEGHLAAAGLVLLTLGLASSECGRRFAATTALALASLVKPILALPLAIRLANWSWRQHLLALVILAVGVLPFASRGADVMTAVADLSQGPGALSSLLALVLCEPLFEAETASQAILIILAAAFALGTALLLWRERHSEDEDPVRLPARLLVLLLVCLPALQPWHLTPLLALLPILRSPGLLVWTASMPLLWLAGDLEPGSPLQAWVPVGAHLPGLAVLAWEALGRPGLRAIETEVAAETVRAS